MTSLGGQLKKIRESKGLSISELSAVSKINVRFLQALEAGEFKTLPGNAFIRGFIKSYAKYCGGNEQKLLADYEALMKQQRGPEIQLLPPKKSTAALQLDLTQIIPLAGLALLLIVSVSVISYFRVGGRSFKSESGAKNAITQTPPPAASAESSQTQSSTWPPVLPNDSVGAAKSNGEAPAGSTQNVSPAVPAADENIQSKESDAARDGARPADNQSSAPPKGTSAQATTANSKPADSGRSAVKENPGSFTLQIVAKENSWISVKRDGEEVLRRMMRPKEQVQFNAKSRFDVVCGNAAGVSLFVDGKPMPPLGGAGQVKSVSFERPAKPATEQIP